MAQLSSTSRMLMGFAKTYFAAEQLPEDSKALKHATIIYAQMSQLTEKLSRTPDIERVSNVVATALEKLKSLGTQSAQQNYKLYEGIASPYLEKAKQNQVSLQQLQDMLKELRGSTFAVIKNILESIMQSPNPADKYASKEVQNEFDKAQKKYTSFHGQLDKMLKEMQQNTRKLEEVCVGTNEALPAHLQIPLAEIALRR